jgi:hypothetical protein
MKSLSSKRKLQIKKLKDKENVNIIKNIRDDFTSSLTSNILSASSKKNYYSSSF